MPTREMWSLPSGSTGVGSNGSRQTLGSSGTYAFMSAAMQLQGGGVMPGIATPHDRSQEVCKYFINGGCLRGVACPYRHELPDERHLDVNGLGFILNPNVHNAEKTVSTPQSNIAGNSTVGQVSPTSTGSPLVLGLGSSNVSRPFQFGPNASNGSPKAGGAKALFSSLSSQTGAVSPAAIKQPPKYRPPEPYLEHNLPPVLALPLKTTPKDVAQSLTAALLQN